METNEQAGWYTTSVTIRFRNEHGIIVGTRYASGEREEQVGRAIVPWLKEHPAWTAEVRLERVMTLNHPDYRDPEPEEY